MVKSQRFASTPMRILNEDARFLRANRHCLKYHQKYLIMIYMAVIAYVTVLLHLHYYSYFHLQDIFVLIKQKIYQGVYITIKICVFNLFMCVN